MMPSEETSKVAIQLVERLGLPVLLTMFFIWALWIRTNSFIALQHEYAAKQDEMCQEQLAVLREIRDTLRGVKHE